MLFLNNSFLAIGSATTLYLSEQCLPLQNLHFTDDLIGIWPLDAVEEYNAEPVYLESNSKFLPTGAEDKSKFLLL